VAVALLLLCPASAGTALGQGGGQEGGKDGWPVFDSSESIRPADGPAFTLRYPPGFSRIPGGDDANPYLRVIQGFVGAQAGDGPPDTALLVALGAELTADEIADAADMGWDSFFGTIGTALQSGMGDFDGAVPLVFKGMQAADLYFSTSTEDPDSSPQIMFTSERALIAGNRILLIGCIFVAGEGVARDKGYTSRDNPASGELCSPFVDSLTIKRAG
jgi:hypothetical protein